MLRPRRSSCVTALVLFGGPLLVGSTAPAQEIESAASTDIASEGTRALVGSDAVLYDNGPPNGLNGYSNATVNIFGARRTLLDDFMVPAGETWRIGGLQWKSLWSTPGGGSFGTGLDLRFRADDGGTPGVPLGDAANVTGYSEVDTGDILFSREVHEHWAYFDDIVLTQGTYWWEATVIGPENNFWLTADQQGNECWVNYDDFNGLESGTAQYGEPSDLNFQLLGDIGCPADVDGSNTVDFADLEAVIAAWGPCEGCPEDLDDDGMVGVPEVLLVLAAWGPCPEPGVGACCLADGTCAEDTTPSECEALGGQLFSFRTCDVITCVGACCFDDGTCVDEVAESACESMGGHFRGGGSTCAINCRTGACCFDDGTCVAAIVEVCDTMGGTYQGDGSTCAATCLGACCFEDGTCENGAAEGACESMGGLFRGAGSTCAVDCQTGACCFDDGTCVAAIEETCDAMGGMHQGDGSTCAATCLGACCFADGTCLDLAAESACEAMGGVFRGPGSTCTSDCQTGACCLPDAPCVQATEEGCVAMGGTHQGDGQSCADGCRESDDCAGAVAIGEGSHSYTTVGSTTDGPDLPEECDEGRGLGFERDVWYRYVPACDGVATASVCDSNFRTRLAIYDNGDCPGPFLACNDDACGVLGTRSEISFPVETGAIYLIRIGSGSTGSVGFGTLVIECSP